MGPPEATTCHPGTTAARASGEMVRVQSTAEEDLAASTIQSRFRKHAERRAKEGMFLTKRPDQVAPPSLLALPGLSSPVASPLMASLWRGSSIA